MTKNSGKSQPSSTCTVLSRSWSQVNDPVTLCPQFPPRWRKCQQIIVFTNMSINYRLRTNKRPKTHQEPAVRTWTMSLRRNPILGRPSVEKLHKLRNVAVLNQTWMSLCTLMIITQTQKVKTNVAKYKVEDWSRKATTKRKYESKLKSFKIHLEKSVWSTWIGRIVPI
jgi:hypothetical protein